ncbi:MAG: hypothetical protein M0P71_01760 [Melioribacteraceae bacterium]|nr:hypothetical protein [Melioribacteraceae bacterium]
MNKLLVAVSFNEELSEENINLLKKCLGGNDIEVSIVIPKWSTTNNVTRDFNCNINNWKRFEDYDVVVFRNMPVVAIESMRHCSQVVVDSVIDDNGQIVRFVVK